MLIGVKRDLLNSMHGYDPKELKQIAGEWLNQKINSEKGRTITKHTCSLCGTDYEFILKNGTQLPKSFPFCSSRCKSIDLGNWLNEEYSILGYEEENNE